MIQEAEEEAKEWVQNPQYQGNVDKYHRSFYLEKMFLFESLMKLHPSADILARIDSIYHVTTYTNYEVLFDWCRLSISCGYLTILPSIQHFLETIGRMKFVYPLYTLLYTTPETKEFAIQVYKENRFRYQSYIDIVCVIKNRIVQMRVDKLMQL